MSGSEFYLKDDDARLIRDLFERIEKLENKIAIDSPIGSLIDYKPLCRSSKWSDTRMDSIGKLWDHWYRFNSLNTGVVEDQNFDEALNGEMLSEDEKHLPLLGQLGGLSSDGGYSAYFWGSNACRIETPLLLSIQRNWVMEAVFKAQSLPQLASVFYNGNSTVNGYGIGIANGTEGESGHQLVFFSPAGNIGTGITVLKEQWYNVIFYSNSADSKLYWYVSTINPLLREFSVFTGSSEHSGSTPTLKSVLGARDSSGLQAFEGWIDEALVYEGDIPITEIKGSALDRIRCSLEPSAPFGFIKADGAEISRAKFPQLFSKIGVSEGEGDGTYTFNLPDVSPSTALIRV